MHMWTKGENDMKNCISCSDYLEDKNLFKEQCVRCLGKERDAMLKKLEECAGDCFGCVGDLNVAATLLLFRAKAINYLNGPFI